VGKQRQYETRRIPFMGLALVCLLFGAPVTAANPEFVAVHVTFVDPVEIRAATAETPAGNPASLIVTDTPRQTSTILVDSANGSFDVTFSYQ
jgi:hypothetical protein